MLGKNLLFSVEFPVHVIGTRFVSVTDRFLGELGPVASGQVPKDLDMKYESLVKGIKYIQIKVCLKLCNGPRMNSLLCHSLKGLAARSV